MSVLAASRPPEPFDKPDLGVFEAPCLAEWDFLGIHFCVNRVTLYMFLAAAIVVVVFVLAASRSTLVPRGVRNLVEWIVEFVREQIALQVIGPKGLPWVPFLTSIFCFILIANMFGIWPGIQYPVTSRMAIPAFLALLVWVLFIATGIRHQGLGYFKNALFPPGVPKALYILLTPIEFISTFLVRPFTLSVRLLANMIAGHLLLTIFFLGAAYLLVDPPYVFGVAAFALGTGLVAFEMLVAVLQAYIFTILTAVYLGGAIEPEH